MTDKKEPATPLPFAETTSWAACHVGRAKALTDGMLALGAYLDAIAARENAPRFTGHPFCGTPRGRRFGCCHVAGHSGPCRFSRRLP